MIDLFAQMAAFTGLGQAWLWAATLVFLRVGAVMFLMPAFGEQVVPQRVRLILALAFSSIVAPAVAPGLADIPGGALAPAVEVMTGLALGIGLRLFIFALQIAAAIIAQATSLSQLFGGTTPDPQPAIGNLLTVAALALAVMSGLHVKAAEFLILSYGVLPAGQFPAASDMADWGLLQIAHAFSLAFALSAPFVIGSVIYNVALGIISRAMPQLSVILVGAPALTGAALVLMMITVPIILTVWLGSFDAFVAHPFKVGP